VDDDVGAGIDDDDEFDMEVDRMGFIVALFFRVASYDRSIVESI
jgi:hypothetical protein